MSHRLAVYVELQGWNMKPVLFGKAKADDMERTLTFMLSCYGTCFVTAVNNMCAALCVSW
jgi:hypothetical protein